MRHELKGAEGLQKKKLRSSAQRKWGKCVMLKWNEKVSNTAEEDLLVRTQQQQDDDFCRALRAALYAGKESCALGVSTQPGTKKPILHYRLPE